MDFPISHPSNHQRTYYRHIGFRPLSTAILSRLLELNVQNAGNIGSFDFALNSPTEYPNVLIEGLFLSNLEDEAKLADKKFKKRFVKKIVKGIEDFLRNADRLPAEKHIAKFAPSGLIKIFTLCSHLIFVLLVLLHEQRASERKY